MSLLRVELSRFVARRAVVVLLLVAAALTVAVAVTTAWSTRPVGAHDLASARAQVAAQVAQPGFQHDLRTCERHPAELFGPGATSKDCARTLTPTTASYLSRAPLSLDAERDGAGLAVAVLVTVLMIVVGATFAGADWTTGSLSTQLLFVPRRGRVWLAKAGAVLLGCLSGAAVLVAAFWLMLYAVAQSRGYSPDAPVLQHVAADGVRAVLLAGVAGLGGFALGMLLRSTVATLIVLFAVAAGGEALVPLLPVDRSATWSLANNVFAWLRDGVRVLDRGPSCGPGQASCAQHVGVSLVHGASYLGVLLGVTLLLSLVLFRRRDVA